jgi:hypothetical protein
MGEPETPSTADYLHGIDDEFVSWRSSIPFISPLRESAVSVGYCEIFTFQKQQRGNRDFQWMSKTGGNHVPLISSCVGKNKAQLLEQKTRDTNYLGLGDTHEYFRKWNRWNTVEPVYLKFRSPNTSAGFTCVRSYYHRQFFPTFTGIKHIRWYCSLQAGHPVQLVGPEVRPRDPRPSVRNQDI